MAIKGRTAKGSAAAIEFAVETCGYHAGNWVKPVRELCWSAGIVEAKQKGSELSEWLTPNGIRAIPGMERGPGSDPLRY